MASDRLSNQVLFVALDQEALDTIDPKTNHAAEEKRVRTRMWFLQTSFNLFREESEGYAKMLTLLYDCIRRPSQMSSPTTVEKCMQIICRFNLTFNKVTELIISAAAEYMEPQLSKSASMPIDHRLPQPLSDLLRAFPENHIPNVVGAMLQLFHAWEPNTDSNAEASPEGTSPAETEQPTPAPLLATVAVLIREGFMTVADVWGYMSPMDNKVFDTRFVEFEKHLLELSKEVSYGKFGKKDMLNEKLKPSPPGRGPSDRDILSTYPFVDSGPLPRFVSQKLHFINMLVGLGRWDDAMSAILLLQVGDVQIDISAHPDMARTLTSLAEVLLQPLFHKTHPDLYHHAEPITEALRQLGGRENRCPVPLDTVDQLVSRDKDGPGAVVRQILLVLGPHARRSPRLLFALCRVLKGRREAEATEVMQNVILPAFSLLQSNTGLSNAIWDVLKEMPHTTRWKLYGHLQNNITKTCAVYKLVAERAAYEMRYILKRLTVDNASSFLTSIAKLTTGQALPAFNATLDRVQGYPADAVTISPVIQACRNCTNLAIDMLLYLLMDRMANSEKSRLKPDGINTAQWFATLSLFLGISLRKLPITSQQIDAVLSFLFTKLCVHEEALMMTALTSIIKCLSDIEVDVNITAKQLKAKAGGRCLQEVATGIWNQLLPDPQLAGKLLDLKAEREQRVATLAMQRAFERSGYHGPIALSLGQFTRSTMYQDEIRSMPLKLGANIVDMARSSLMQLCKFINYAPRGTRESDVNRKNLWDPLISFGITRMISQMNIPISCAAELVAPSLDFLETCDTRKVQVSAAKDEKSECDSRMEVERPGDTDTAKGVSPTEQEAQKADGRTPNEGDPVNEFVANMVKQAHGTLSAHLLHSFWTLKLGDIAVPADLYQTETKRFRSAKIIWEKQVDMMRRHGHSDLDRRSKVEAELSRIAEYSEQLQKEYDMALKRKSQVRETFLAKKSEFGPNIDASAVRTSKAAIIAFIRLCILPKCKASQADATFCARFVQMLLELDMPALVYADYFAMFMHVVPLALQGCSENEAISLSLLVKEVLSTLESWRSNRKLFEAEAGSGKSNGFRDQQGPASDRPMRHEQFCQWLFDIHQALTDGLYEVLRSKEFMHHRNSLSLLAKVSDVYPKVIEHASKIEERVRKLSRSELEDLRLVSTGVLARLQAGKAKRLPKHIFTLRPSASCPPADDAKKASPPLPAHSKASAEKEVKAGLGKQGELSASKEKSSAAMPARKAVREASASKPKVADEKKDELKLNPNAAEFALKRQIAPGSTSASASGGGIGKRSRDGEGDPAGRGSEKARGDLAPPLKKARGDELSRSNSRGSGGNGREAGREGTKKVLPRSDGRRPGTDRSVPRRGERMGGIQGERGSQGAKRSPPGSSVAVKRESLRTGAVKEAPAEERKGGSIVKREGVKKSGGEKGIAEDLKRPGIRKENGEGARNESVGMNKGSHSMRRDVRKREGVVGERDRDGRSPREAVRGGVEGGRRRDHVGPYEYDNGPNSRGSHGGDYGRKVEGRVMEVKRGPEHGREGGGEGLKRRREYGHPRGGYYEDEDHRVKRSRVEDGEKRYASNGSGEGRYDRGRGQREYGSYMGGSGGGGGGGWDEKRRVEDRRVEDRRGEDRRGREMTHAGWQGRSEYERRRDERDGSYERRDDRGRGRERRNRGPPPPGRRAPR